MHAFGWVHTELDSCEVSSRSASTFISISFFPPNPPAAGPESQISIPFCDHIQDSVRAGSRWEKGMPISEKVGIFRLNSPQEEIYEAIKETLFPFLYNRHSIPPYLVIYLKLLSSKFVPLFSGYTRPCFPFRVEFSPMFSFWPKLGNSETRYFHPNTYHHQVYKSNPFLCSPITLNISSVTIEYLSKSHSPTVGGWSTNHKQ